ncbi:hypothetical protein J0X14_03990 [Muricauda sp. CAU 1633]|uniref:hypothetical protein n=1 Tax=Allomuricauda sp. CAU 1633 TaxID=2816036 RepID=UPI001A8CF0DB|nr:hypothetical protein [Muricauda sp. CAU 1633]MBO0321447.1 hypothetical protein [Muricauda sp. CAU 1633]
MSSMYNILAALLCSLLFCLPAFTQINEETHARLETFLEESSITSFEQVTSDAIEYILDSNVYVIKRKTLNTYQNNKVREDRFIVLDAGEEILHFEQINRNTSLDDFLGHIKNDFILDPQTAPLFEELLDIVYPVAAWKVDKREFFHKNGSWYFLRDAYFRTKQGFEVTTDADGKITSIRYKMKWDEPDRS